MASRSVTFDLPLPPWHSRATHGKHWAVLRREKREWEFLATIMLTEQGVKLPKEPWGRVRVALHFRLYNRQDRDNLVSRAKLILDALKQTHQVHQKSSHGPSHVFTVRHRGFFLDDSDEYIELEMPTQEINRKNQGVTVTLEAIDE